MENWKLTLIILSSVFAGAMIPLIITITLLFYRAGKKIAQIGSQVSRTMEQIEIISSRVEVLSRGLKGGEKDLEDLFGAAGNIARSLERNGKIINTFSAILASLAPIIVDFVAAKFHKKKGNNRNSVDDSEPEKENPAPDVNETL